MFTDFYVFLRIFYGCLRIFTDFYGFLRFFTYFLRIFYVTVFLRIFTDFCVVLRIFYGCLRIFTDFYRFLSVFGLLGGGQGLKRSGLKRVGAETGWGGKGSG